MPQSLRIVVLLLAGCCASGAQAQETIRIHGSNTIGERLAPALVEAWMRRSGYLRIERFAPAAGELTLRATAAGRTLDVELHAHGSATGMSDLLAGRADLAMSSRPVSAEERERGSVLGQLDSPELEAVLALDGVAVIVNRHNPVTELGLEQVRAIFSGALRDWSQLGKGAGAIRVLARDGNSGTWDTFRSLVLGDLPLRGDAIRLESSQELARKVAADRDAIGFVGLAAIGEARALAIREAGHALAPTVFSVAVEDYALSRRLYLYRAEIAPDMVISLVEYALSADGQHVVEANGFVAQQVRAYAGEVRADATPEYRDLVSGAERLSLNFRFSTGASLLDGKALRDIDRLAEHMRQPGLRDRSLLLLGFSDASETSAYQSLSLSNDRVDFIAGRLQQRGLVLRRLRGMGGNAPIASNQTPAGRQRNRRVEVWVAPPEDKRRGTLASSGR